MPTMPLAEENQVTPDAFFAPGVVWVVNPLPPTGRAVELVMEWCDRHGLNGRRIPADGGLRVRLATPDGGLVADVVEYEWDEELDVPKKPAHSTGRLPLKPSVEVPVDTIPPARGLIPAWAATLTKETR
ncbi:hypothetical protein [Phycicoccus sp. 3266]|uniref:hypothetical protein n=1 Tax=Phycicoccus sp. 3266 TaxID=2817751 RepID=UPI002854D06C|nr:hypothetical protein [Phycicoccus sp. 3266]MDR6861952.1 hypothetical protein [Phycicoccus sp. 3266]